MANTISAVGEAAGLRSPAVTGVVNDIRDDALQRRQLLDRLSPAGLGSLAWRRLRTEGTKSTMLQSGHVGLLKGVTLRGVPSIRAGAIAGDRYLVELGELCKVPWDGVVLPGLSDEHERQHGSVQFAFASSSFWDLPILAHEFGHVVEGRRRTTALDGIEQVLDLQQLLNRAAVEHGFTSPWSASTSATPSQWSSPPGLRLRTHPAAVGPDRRRTPRPRNAPE